MKFINLICRILLGGLFIFSGLIKINDPYGFAYKLEEYFEIFSHDFSPIFTSFIPYSLFFSVSISAFEIILGVAILLYYRMNLVMWLTLLMMIFFTFLTFYAFWWDKVKECGCFGDAIKLTPKTSFYKDLILTALTLVLFAQRKRLLSSYNGLKGHALMLVVSLGAFYIGYYAILHLPYKDFLPYKVGSNIKEQMKAPEAPIYKYIMTKDGKQYEFIQYPTDPGFKLDTFVLTNPDKIYAPITDYKLWNDQGDYTDSSLTGKKLFIIIKDADKAAEKCNQNCMVKVNDLVKGLEGTDIKAIAVTSTSGDKFEEYRHEMQLAVPYYFADGVVLKTMIRANPGIMLLDNGTVLGKWHYNDVPDVQTIKSLLH